MFAPFPKLSALCKQTLTISTTQKRSPSPPGNDPRTNSTCVPGEPSITLNQASVQTFLTEELSTPLLDELYPHLWFAARKSGKSIDPLNRQKARGREVVATEDARMHLVWHHEKIHVKPIPLCLLNYDFWATFLPVSMTHSASSSEESRIDKVSLSSDKFDRNVALGFMRSYALLVRYRSDFILAREAHLFPLDLEWLQWAEFIAHFRHLDDSEVAKRYHYGQLRLSRLNWVVRLFRPPSARTYWFYEIPYWSTGKYIKRAFAPVIFTFASVSIVLSAMQVALAIPDNDGSFMSIDAVSLLSLRRACSVFSIMVLFVLLLLWLFMLVIPLSALIWQFLWGYRDSRRTKTKRLEHSRPKGTGTV